ncbi:MAG: hypothetical protein KZQ70_05630 [gamma proteobacterium symbiont of Lucinoma myriamae]|nr:hypothetical protein [gamma proteobacterium symbiont of Lucinoma myriamae]MCU7817301.1 hypothetical protein [gamma proteobacterium symbiont of Lucinoma myriamae]
MMFIGILLICIAIGLNLWLEKRRFLRTRAGGVQEFESYGSLWKARFIEVGTRIFLIILFIIGVVTLIKGYVAP